MIRFCNHKNKHVIALCLFFVVMILVGLLYMQWGFYWDDYLDLHYASQATSFTQIMRGDSNAYFIPSYINPVRDVNFFNALYRPLNSAIHVAQHTLFGDWGYGYLLCNAFFHALSTVLLFYLLLFFCGIWGSLFGALLFAFHPQIGFRFGHMANVQYYLNVVFFLLIVFLLKQHLDQRDTKSLWGAWFLFFCSVFLRETGLALMGIIPVSMYLYLYYQQKTYVSIKTFVMQYWWAIIGFWTAGFSYMAARVYYCPLTLNQGSCALKSIDTYVALAKWRIYREGSWFLQDFFGLSWLSLRPAVLLLFAFLLFGCFILFLQSRRKLLLGWLIMAICMLLWPCFILQYGPLYFYETSPCAVVFFMCLFACRKKEWSTVAVWAGKIMGTLFILWLMIMCYTNMRCREQKMEIRKQALREFVANPDIKGRPLWILTFPIDGLYPSIAHAIWYYSGTYDTRIMTDSSSWIFNNWGFTTDSWLVRCCPYPDKNNYEITKHNNVIRITSLDPEKIRISHNYKSLDIPLGRNTVLATHGDVITDLSIDIDQKWVELDPLFVVWDFEQQKFRLLE